MRRQISRAFGIFAAVAMLVGCAQGTLSERDTKLEQIRLQAEARRRELQVAVGNYKGTSTQEEGASHDIKLHLEIKEIPTQVEGIAEPVPMPYLNGSLRFYIGTGPGEFIVYAIDKAGFNSTQNTIDIVANNPQYHELVSTLKLTEPDLKGDWSVSKLSSSGKFSLTRTTEEIAPEESP